MPQHVVLIVLMIGATADEASKRIMDIFQKVVTPASTQLGLTVSTYPVHQNFYNEFAEDIKGLKVSYKLTDGAKPPKGFSITHLLNSAHLLGSKPDYILYCDGSGRIPFEHCIDVLKELKSGSVSCVLANRVPWRSGISDSRKVIEEFESSLVCQQFNIAEVQDLQCGLWGFAYPDCSEMKIDCVGYELELNIASEAFKKIKKIGVINININESGTSKTQFATEDYSNTSSHFQKAYFLYKYFNLTKEKLVQSAHHHNGKQTPEKKLSTEYIDMLDKIDEIPKKPDIIKLS